jgi:hypothetical protein
MAGVKNQPNVDWLFVDGNFERKFIGSNWEQLRKTELYPPPPPLQSNLRFKYGDLTLSHSPVCKVYCRSVPVVIALHWNRRTTGSIPGPNVAFSATAAGYV